MLVQHHLLLLSSRYQRWLERYHILRFVHGLVPLLAGGLMLGAVFLPWLNDPLGESYRAWNIALDVGWQVHARWLNYSVLCLCCAVVAFYRGLTFWRPRWQKREVQLYHLLPVGMLCLTPTIIFYVQYLCVDVHLMEVLAQHKQQALLIEQHVGYHYSNDLLSLDPFRVDSATLGGRLQLLMNQVGIGQLLPLVSGWLLISYHFLSAGATERAHKGLRLSGWCCALGVALVVLGRGPAAVVCEAQAKEFLAIGSYAGAMRWLDRAVVLNPQLEQVTYYHVQRGQAWYFLHPQQQNADSLSYLGAVYQGQGDLLGADQDLQALQILQKRVPGWSTLEKNQALIRLVEMQQQQNGPPMQRLEYRAEVLPWLQEILRDDPGNVYAHYVSGRIAYDQQDYAACFQQMVAVLRYSGNQDIQSTAYTYMALSVQGQGKLAEARNLLFKAQALDPHYHNATAREELSGLH